MTTFSELFQSYSRDVYRFALFLSGDHDVAEDIASETFIRVWYARERLELGTVKAYLLTIARNLYLDHRRRAAPIIAAAWWFTAAVLWGWHIWVRRRLAVSGI